MTELTHVIGGDRRAPSEAATLDVVDPATDNVLGRIPAGSEEDADIAVTAAAAAASGWATTAPGDRAGAVGAWAAALRAHADELASLQTSEGGTPVARARQGVDGGIAALDRVAELGPSHAGGPVSIREPRGVAGVLAPWHDPVGVACRLVGAALMTGNAVVLKPSEKTPLGAARMVELAADILPPGVLNLLLGDERSGRPLSDHPTVDVVCHVGSEATAREVAERCARRLARAVLSHAGDVAMLVDEGVDAGWAAGLAAAGAFGDGGQTPTAVERLYVHHAVADAFLDELVRLAKARRVGPGSDPATEMGPLIDRAWRDHVHSHVTEAVVAGATCLAGGEVPGGRGAFYSPTVLVGVDDGMAVTREVTFGPVAPIAVASSFDEALARAATRKGLGAIVLTPSAERARAAAHALHVGVVQVNGPLPPAALPDTDLLDELTRPKVVHLEP